MRQNRKVLSFVVLGTLMGLGGALAFALVVRSLPSIILCGMLLADVLLLGFGTVVIVVALRFMGLGKTLALAGVLLVVPAVLQEARSLSGALPVVLLLLLMGTAGCSGRKEGS